MLTRHQYSNVRYIDEESINKGILMTVVSNAVIPTVSRIIWRLRETLARRRVTNKALADAIGIHPTNVSRLKNRDTLPAIGGDEIEKIRVAITELSSEEFGICTLSELIELKEE